MPIKLTTDEFVLRAKKVHGPKYEYSKVRYTNSTQPVLIECLVHGKFEQSPASHLMGKGCRNCHLDNQQKNFGLGRKEFVKRSVEKHGNLYDYSKVKYLNSSTEVRIKCPTHGEFLQTPSGHLISDVGCPKCRSEKSSNRLSYSTEQFVKLAKKVHLNLYTYENTEYHRSQKKVAITCPTHGDFYQRPYHHLQNGGCPRCSRSVSSQQEVLFKWLDKRGIESKVSDRQEIGSELDLWIPSHTLAIEVDGVHWHSEQFGYTKERHLSKVLLAKKKGITLFRFWDHEVNGKRRQLLNVVKSRLGLNDRIGARECDLKEVSNKECKEFLNKNHLQGHLDAHCAVGLFYKQRLVGIMSFGRSRFDTNQWEMYRMCFSYGLTVVGGASRMLTWFERQHTPSELVTYAALRYSRGSSYQKLGFKYSHRSEPGYQYVHKNGGLLISRYSAQKRKLKSMLGNNFDPQLSERHNMMNNGYYRLWDCGNLVFIKRYTN